MSRTSYCYDKLQYNGTRETQAIYDRDTSHFHQSRRYKSRRSAAALKASPSFIFLLLDILSLQVTFLKVNENLLSRRPGQHQNAGGTVITDV